MKQRQPRRRSSSAPKLPLVLTERGVTTSIIPYYEQWGRRPKGFATWIFLIGKDMRYFSNEYYKARREAMALARSENQDDIVLIAKVEF